MGCCAVPRRAPLTDTTNVAGTRAVSWRQAPPPCRAAGLSPSQIGQLSALRPWVSAPCGSLIAGLADRWGAHRFLLLFCYVAMTLIQASRCRSSWDGFNLALY